jgi:hypothetical protein
MHVNIIIISSTQNEPERLEAALLEFNTRLWQAIAGALSLSIMMRPGPDQL